MNGPLYGDSNKSRQKSLKAQETTLQHQVLAYLSIALNMTGCFGQDG